MPGGNWERIGNRRATPDSGAAVPIKRASGQVVRAALACVCLVAAHSMGAEEPDPAATDAPTFYVFGHVEANDRAAIAEAVRTVGGVIVNEVTPDLDFVIQSRPMHVGNDMINAELIGGALRDASDSDRLKFHPARRVSPDEAMHDLSGVLEREAAEQERIRKNPVRRVEWMGNYTLDVLQLTPRARLSVDGIWIFEGGENVSERIQVELLIESGRHVLVVELPDGSRAEVELRTSDEGRARISIGRRATGAATIQVLTATR